MKRYGWILWLIGLPVVLLGGVLFIYVFWIGVPGVDCAWAGRAEAWLDSNRDGIRDPQEPPLPGIPFYIDDTYNDYLNVGSYALSDEHGAAELSVWLPGCPRTRFEVYVDVLPDYALTTPARHRASRDGGELYGFGFVYNLAATPTPHPTVDLSCKPSIYEDALGGLAEDWDVAPDGTLWAVFDGYDTVVTSFNPATNEYNMYTREANGLGNVPTGIAAGADGTIWLTSVDGVDRFAGTSWTRYTTVEGLADDMVGAVETTTDGTVWFATEVGIAQYYPDTEAWTTQSEVGGGIGGTSYSDMTVTPDGSLWLITNDAAYHLPDASAKSPASDWITYYENSDQAAPLAYVDTSAIAPDGSLWIAGFTHQKRSAVARFVPASREWTLYTYLTTNGAMGTDRISRLVAAQDGSIWMGTYASGGLRFIPPAGSASQGTWLRFQVPDGQPDESTIPLLTNPDGTIEIEVNHGLHHCTIEG